MGTYQGRGIWAGSDPRYEIDRVALTGPERTALSRLEAVDRAKKRSTMLSPIDLLKIDAAIRLMPPAAGATVEDIARYLQSTLSLQGAGAATVICMLAVQTSGDYAPIDRKVLAGFAAKEMLTRAEE